MIERTIAIGALELDGGQILPAVDQRIAIYGDPACGRFVLVLHALTGDHRAAAWWPGIVGEGALLDPREYCIVGVNMLGSCYGSTPTRERITIADIVRAQRRALDIIGIERIDIAIGGSMGGMQALQWAHDAPERVGRAIAIGAPDRTGTTAIAFNAIQRDALALDPVAGLGLARKIAMLTYKSDALLSRRHGRRPDRNGGGGFDIEGFLDLQAARILERIDAATYRTLTHAMDSFDLRESDWPENTPPLTFVGISSDTLFPAREIRDAAELLACRGIDARYIEMRSEHGHDAFLAEDEALAELVAGFTRERAAR
ncbi:MAG: alpha/beta fold hydrolase [Candidatus Baltobacteraceae bacterium]